MKRTITSNKLFNTMKTATVIDTKTHRLLMGNEAMGRGLIEAGVSLAASYPGHAGLGDSDRGGGLCQGRRGCTSTPSGR